MDKFDFKKTGSYLIIGAIAFIFAIQWGPGSKGCESPLSTSESTAAARVNGKEIPLKEFSRQYATRLQSFRAQGGELPEGLARQMGLPNQVLEAMVNQELLTQEAERQGILASDDELRDVLRNHPYFQVEGKFDAERYRDVVINIFRKTIPEYEQLLRRDLAAQKLLDAVADTANVSADEVRARFLKDGNKANLTYVRFTPAMFQSKVPAPKPAEVTAYKAEHAKDIEAYYNGNIYLYQTTEQVHARHILIKAGKDATADQKAEAKKKIEALRKEIEGGKDFAQVAKESSEDTGTKASGGDLGLNERSGWVPEFSAAAFALKPGELSQPVETPFGYHLIKVDEKKPAQKKELKQVEDEIARQLLTKQKAKDLARAEAQKALAALQAGKKLTDVYPAAEKSGDAAASRFETETKPEAVQTGDFSASGGTIPRLGQAAELSQDVFAAEGPKKLAKVYSVGEGFAVGEVTDRKLPTDADFDANKEKLTQEARRAKQVELRDSFLKALKKSGKVETNPKAIEQVSGQS